uniref:TF_AP-2 domain-containing protein n=1 Tax=Strongyloides papillosus TaxID=174720 RepID=A0A0N5BGS5_STREA
MSHRSSSTPVQATTDRYGNISNGMVQVVPTFPHAQTRAELGFQQETQQSFPNAFLQAELGLSKDAKQPYLALSRADTHHYDGVNPIMSSMTSPKASAPLYGDSLEGSQSSTSFGRGNKIRSSFNNLINKITNPVSSKPSMESAVPLNRTKRQVDLDNVVKLILDELKSDQVETLKYSPSDYDGLLQRQKARMTKLLQDLGSDAIVDLPDVRAQVSDNLGSTRSYNALFDMVLRAKSHGAFYQFKGKSLTSFTLFISDCMTAIRQLAITDDEIPMLDRIAGRHIDYLIPRDSKIAHARHI